MIDTQTYHDDAQLLSKFFSKVGQGSYSQIVNQSNPPFDAHHSNRTCMTYHGIAITTENKLCVHNTVLSINIPSALNFSKHAS